MDDNIPSTSHGTNPSVRQKLRQMVVSIHKASVLSLGDVRKKLYTLVNEATSNVDGEADLATLYRYRSVRGRQNIFE